MISVIETLHTTTCSCGAKLQFNASDVDVDYTVICGPFTRLTCPICNNKTPIYDASLVIKSPSREIWED